MSATVDRAGNVYIGALAPADLVDDFASLAKANHRTVSGELRLAMLRRLAEEDGYWAEADTVRIKRSGQ